MKWDSFDPGPKLDRRPKWVPLGCSLRDEVVVEPRTIKGKGAEKGWVKLDQPVPRGAVVLAGPAGAAEVEDVDGDDVLLAPALDLPAETLVDVQLHNTAPQIARYLQSGNPDGLILQHAVEAQISVIDAERRDIIGARSGTFSAFGARVQEAYSVALARLAVDMPGQPHDMLEHAILREMSEVERDALAEYRAWALAFSRDIAAAACTQVRLPDGRTLPYQRFISAARDPGEDVPDEQKAAMVRLCGEVPREIQAHMSRMQEVAHRGKS